MATSKTSMDISGKYCGASSYYRKSELCQKQTEDTNVKYICLVYGEESKIGAMTDDECMEYDGAIRKSGNCIASEALQRTGTAKTLKIRNGEVTIMDGPFAETKEALAGFYLVDAKDMGQALEIAAMIPPAQVGCIEVRPVRELVNTRGEKRHLA